MAVKTHVIRNSVDGKFDVFHWDPAAFDSSKVRDAVSSNTGTGDGKYDTHRDTDRSTSEGR